jgi:hypothetical protein
MQAHIPGLSIPDGQEDPTKDNIENTKVRAICPHYIPHIMSISAQASHEEDFLNDFAILLNLFRSRKSWG